MRCRQQILSVAWMAYIAFVSAIGRSAAVEDEPPAEVARAKALEIGDRRQVFIDGRFLETAEGVELCLHRPVRTGEHNIRAEHPWESGGLGVYLSVMRIGGEYLMWYHAMDTLTWHGADDRGCVCLARSDDGIRWTKPELGLVEYKGSRKNNIVLGHGAAGVRIGQSGCMVFLDPKAPASQRYRMVRECDEVGEGIHIFSSADGIRWELTHRAVLHARPQKQGHHLDTQNVIFWDDRIAKYVAYGRVNLRGSGSQGRAIFRGEASSLGEFPAVQDLPVVIQPDRMDLFQNGAAVVDYYTNAAIKYPWSQDAYYMFPTAYYHYTPGGLSEFGKGVPTNAGPLHTQFAASRDGIAWHRFGRQAFVDLGRKGEFDWAACRMIHGIVPSVDGRDLYLYYWGSDRLHGWDRNDRNKELLSAAGLGATRDVTVISRLAIRRDGFVSARGAYTGGEFTTPPLVFRGGRLHLNVDTSATGIVGVAILKADGDPVPGLSLEDCDLIHTANDGDRVVTWKGRSDVGRIAGSPVRLRFRIRDADLYAFQFQD